MSSQMIVNPDELERFAKELKQFNKQLGGSMSRLQGRFKNLSETWRDQEHKKFAQEFEQTMRILDQFRKTSEKQVPFLLRKAKRAKEYLSHR